MSDESFRRNQGADPGLPGSDTGEPVGPAGEGGEPLQEPRTLEPQVKQGSSENDGRSDVNDRFEFKIVSNCC